MRMIPAISVIAVLLAAGSVARAADEASARSGWYLGAGLGAGRTSDLNQEGWNRDRFCTPDAACFDEAPIPTVPGYRWRYDIELDSGAAFELSVGRFFGRTRLELAIGQQTNDTRQVFTGISYLNGAAIRPRAGGPVASNASGAIDHRRVRSVTLDAFYDFPNAWGAVTPYLGAGLGQASVEMAGVRFSTDYRNVSAAARLYEPPLSFYNSVQEEDLNDTAFVWRLHAGANYALGRGTSLGLRLTWSAAGDSEDTGAYETHPMHGVDPAFTNTNKFSGGRNWTLMLSFRRGVAD
ncbi:MAG: outer membrane beta-barrel protein [Gammaproteobacteria bacterium]|nr:outer membrane beta-barrel protein [Gammaproteobacteria bacterium]